VAKSCSIVIGAGLGDEGKGHYTDILCNKPNTLNIRFNGGPQAAHTVVTPDGMKHVFRHLGAGTFTGAATYLSADFLVNPIEFVMEKTEFIKRFKYNPVVFVNLNSPVTTLYDMYINQAVEEYRDKSRHGSCGMGIWETCERNNDPMFKITVRDLSFKTILSEKLKRIRDIYVPKRLKEEYGIEISDLKNLSKDFPSLLVSDETIEMFLFYAEEFLSMVMIRDDSIINNYENLVFEGAQGLGLDENNPDCSVDYLTPSTTGVKNAMKILKTAKYKGAPDVYYISRPYATRHGMGPLEHEVGEAPYKKVVDETNVKNEYQGALRFAYIDFDVLARRINRDINNICIPSTINIGFTCLDQLDEPVGISEGGILVNNRSADFINKATNYFKNAISRINSFSGTYGLTRDEFEEF